MDREFESTLPSRNSIHTTEGTSITLSAKLPNGVPKGRAWRLMCNSKSEYGSKKLLLNAENMKHHESLDGIRILETKKDADISRFLLKFEDTGEYVCSIDYVDGNTDMKMENMWNIRVFSLDQIQDVPTETAIRLLEDLLALYTLGEVGMKTISRVKRRLDKREQDEDAIIQSTTLDEFVDDE